MVASFFLPLTCSYSDKQTHLLIRVWLIIFGEGFCCNLTCCRSCVNFSPLLCSHSHMWTYVPVACWIEDRLNQKGKIWLKTMSHVTNVRYIMRHKPVLPVLVSILVDWFNMCTVKYLFVYSETVFVCKSPKNTQCTCKSTEWSFVIEARGARWLNVFYF